MASAQNFFNSTPAPDPRQNPLAAGVAGGLQGLADQGQLQRQMQLMQYQNQQKQMSDMLNAGAQNHQAGFGPGPDGSTPMQIGGQQGYWDPNGMSPAGQMDMSKAALYQTMNQNKQGAGNPEALSAYHGALELLKAKAQASIDAKGNSTFDTYGELDKLHKYMNDHYNQGDQGSPDSQDSPQPWQPGQPKTEAQSSPKSAAQQMFSQATGKTSATPRSQRLTAEIASAILKQAGGDKQKARAIAKQQGFTF